MIVLPRDHELDELHSEADEVLTEDTDKASMMRWQVASEDSLPPVPERTTTELEEKQTIVVASLAAPPVNESTYLKANNKSSAAA